MAELIAEHYLFKLINGGIYSIVSVTRWVNPLFSRVITDISGLKIITMNNNNSTPSIIVHP